MLGLVRHVRANNRFLHSQHHYLGSLLQIKLDRLVLDASQSCPAAFVDCQDLHLEVVL
ncbi:uncharacterized protein PHALS_01393 [Plasmopara halstedii]|uniref:Uncharacterized protein n=1 Tax=Plasmopara halstedii TaxID=4781 RepID=A0A0P1ASM2_PLAHL|nr:uncharacterized protein PHALS_01393 [Plasmopara halstedii]CEG45066.1 hypothetical protein PHALS_01393 [Plasmopara halstedii]|eukprot:XP_024581435.1 hypothetical protein PHALS_01393 [Plasmopara halstedii]